ncbi:MAG: nucleotide exchange factor GrpE [SAR202 cluster bacterium]|jgi:molecular chaperone GrpE|nr:nucleotide exchange factor GrpE [Chloroflexota bacterium]MDP6422578.1 nucleotide exchange factor GrpE [SAR202 cluster bacterium]HAL49533.1 nucleotide exchange factor GrpE [Dehalococcoidia bacterium]MDP6662885.1 nucleotide exchange factor GrpE [SAR202 cluster bacterium]MDP6799693.1 nucleotide exchange factor GrpE [SAR202 cluster bacterium]|tara:strand:- start:1078 stop:1674 length:597 start_codon:yes stop_codon:yes gene_type:complete
MTEEQQPDELERLEQQLDEELDEPARLQAELDETVREKDQLKGMAQRAQADLVNYRRRAAEEMTESRQNSNSRLLVRLLMVLDDMNRAFDAIPEDAVAPGWLDGLELVRRNLQNVMDSEGVTKIETAVGQPFDVHEHEAVFFEPSTDREEGSVMSVIRDGYKLHDRVLRAAQVSVSQRVEPDPPATEERKIDIDQEAP